MMVQQPTYTRKSASDIARVHLEEIERLSNSYGHSSCHGRGLQRSFSNSYGTTTSNDDDVVIEGSERAECKEEIIWGNMELDIGFQPPDVQNKIDMDITESDDDRAATAKAKRS